MNCLAYVFFQIRTMFGILLPVMLIDGLQLKRSPNPGPGVGRVPNLDQSAHRMLFIFLGQVIQLLCVRRITRNALDTAHNILKAYNTLFALCFPLDCVPNQHFNGSHLRGNHTNSQYIYLLPSTTTIFIYIH
jgi:hypothetical protein